MYNIIIKKLDKIVVWDYITITNRPSQYDKDTSFIHDIFQSGCLSSYSCLGVKHDKAKIFNLTIVDDELETTLYDIALSMAEVDYIYYLLASLEYMEFIYIKSLSIKDIYKRFAFDTTKRMLHNNPNAKEYFIKYIEPIINRSFNQTQDKIVTCLDMKEFELYFHRIEKIYLKVTPKDKRIIDQYQLYALLFAAKNRYLNTINIENRI